MTAKLEKHAELHYLQTEIRKAIYQHYNLQNKARTDSSDSVQAEILQIQKQIRQLCEKQKIAFANLRKTLESGQLNDNNVFKNERKRPLPAGALLSAKISAGQLNSTQIIKKSALQADGSIKIPQQALAVRTLGGQTKLLIPFSPSNAKKGGQQIFVVPSTTTSTAVAAATNGTRLTPTSTVTNANSSAQATGQKASLIKSIVVDANSGTSKAIIQRAIQTAGNSTKIIGNVSPNALAASNATFTGHSLLSQNASKSILANKSPNNNASNVSSNGSNGTNSTQSGIQLRSSVNSVQSIQFDTAELEKDLDVEAKYKEEFFAALGLVTKKALHDIQNKKGERKRRTTANPHFSNAAIEAKRISAMELAAKKAKKREQLLAANKTGSPTLTTRSGNKRVFLATNRGKDVSDTSSNQNNSSSKTVDSKRATGVSRSTANSKAAAVNGSTAKNLNCFICEELCEVELDAVATCKFCKCVFHATCSNHADKIVKTMTVSCPKCDHRVRLEGAVCESSVDDDAQEPSVDDACEETNSKETSTLTNNNGKRKTKGSKSNSKKTDSSTINSNNSSHASNHHNVSSNSSNAAVKSNSSPSNLINEPDAQSEEDRKNLLLKQINLNKQLQDYEKRLLELDARLETSGQKGKRIAGKRDTTKKAIERILRFVKEVQENPEQKENCMSSENDEKETDPTSSSEPEVIQASSSGSASIEALRLPKLNPIITEAANSGTDPVDLVESFMRCDESEIPAKRLKFESDDNEESSSQIFCDHNYEETLETSDETTAAVASIQIDL